MDPPIPLEEAPSIGVAATPPSAPDLEEAHQPLRAAHSQDPTKITKTLETIAHVRIASLKSIQEVLSQSTDSEDIVWADWIADHYINQPSQKEETSAIVTPYALNILFQSFKRARTLSNRTICTDEWPFYTTGFKKLTQQMIKQLIKPVQEFNYAPSATQGNHHQDISVAASPETLSPARSTSSELPSDDTATDVTVGTTVSSIEFSTPSAVYSDPIITELDRKPGQMSKSKKGGNKRGNQRKPAVPTSSKPSPLVRQATTSTPPAPSPISPPTPEPTSGRVRDSTGKFIKRSQSAQSSPTPSPQPQEDVLSPYAPSPKLPVTPAASDRKLRERKSKGSSPTPASNPTMFTPINKDGKTEDDKIEGVETTPQSRKRAAERVETTPRGKKRYKRSKLSQEYIPNSESDDDKAPSDAPRTESGKVQEPVAMTPTVSKPVTMPSESITNTRGASDKLGEASKNTEVPENLDAEGSNIGTEGSAKAPTANQTISAISWDEAAVAQARSDAELALQMQMDLDADPRDRFLLSPERGEISSGSRASEDAELFGDEESFLMIGVDLDPLSSKRATRSGKDDHHGGAVRRSSRLDSQQNKRSSQRQMRISTPERGESSKGKQRHFRPGLEFFARVTRGDKVTEIPLPMVSFNEDPAMLLGYAEWKEREPAGTNLTYEAFCEVKKFTATRD